VVAGEGAWLLPCWEPRESQEQTAAGTGPADRKALAGSPAAGEAAEQVAAWAPRWEDQLQAGLAAKGAAAEDWRGRDEGESWRARATAGKGPVDTLPDPLRMVGTLAVVGTGHQETEVG